MSTPTCCFVHNSHSSEIHVAVIDLNVMDGCMGLSTDPYTSVTILFLCLNKVSASILATGSEE